ncbi:MAG: hypothetical protein JXJ19_09205 [Elusimicrobia bacterium]|nr:hypothetical protein [Elusimicrobiota bacterium]
MKDKKEETIKYYYTFKFPDGKQYTFTIYLTPDRMGLIRPEGAEMPGWARLNNFKCENCTFDEAEKEYCPVALNLVDIIHAFKDVISTEVVDVIVRSPEREIYNNVPIQKAISSLMGMCMAISGCPILSKFAPMAKFHLPFATVEETMYRTISNYLLAQYFVMEEGGTPDWKLQGLKTFYNEVETVNRSLCDRVRSASLHDANVNAVVFLDNFAKNITFLIDHVLNNIRPIFKAYIDEVKRARKPKD